MNKRKAYAASFAQVQPEVTWAQIQAENAAAQQAALGTPESDEPGMGESLVRGGFQGATLGYGDEVVAGLQSIGKPTGSYRRIRDEIRAQNERAQNANPLTYGVGDILGSLAPALVTGGASEAASAGSLAARAAASGAVQGAVSGVGYSNAEGVGDILADAAKGAAIGGVTGAVTGHLAGNAMENAEANATQNFTRDITKGADPSFRKRFLGQTDKLAKQGNATEQAEASRALLESDKEMVGLLKKPHAEDAQAASDIVDHTKGKLDELTGEVRPLYKKLDEEAGQVPMGDAINWMDQAIDQARTKHGGEALEAALSEARGNFVKVELAKAAKAGLITEGADDVEQQIAKLSLPHQDVRQWVTGLLDEKFLKMGSLSETERFTLANDVHRVADNFLRTHLDLVAKEAPSLAPDVARIRELNKQIAVYAGTKQLFQHKVAKGLMRQTAWQEATNSRLNQLAGVIGAAATGSPIGAFKAIALSEGIKRGIGIGKEASKAATAALAKIVRAARNGDPTAQLVQKAIEVGVPSAAISSVLGVYRSAGNELSSAE